MFPTPQMTGSKQERALIKLYKSLNQSDKESLLVFAEFLLHKEKLETDASSEEIEIVSEPLDIERPEKESVIKAIRRLRETYPMVDEEKVLHPISGLMTAHMLQGKKANQVIDELEDLFRSEYDKNKE